MRYFRLPTGRFSDKNILNPNNIPDDYIWCVGPDFSYALYISGKVGRLRLTNRPFLAENCDSSYPFKSFTSDIEWADDNVKKGMWIECDRQGNPLEVEKETNRYFIHARFGKFEDITHGKYVWVCSNNGDVWRLYDNGQIRYKNKYPDLAFAENQVLNEKWIETDKNGNPLKIKS